MKDGCPTLKRTTWSLLDQGILFRRLGRLLEEGYSLNGSLQILKFQIKEKQRADLEKLMDYLKDGETFHGALQRLSFHPSAAGFAYYGEGTGRLAETLQACGNFLLKRAADRKRVRKILSYPVFLLMVSSFLFTIIQLQILPRFLQLFRSFQKEPSGILKFWIFLYDGRGIFMALLFFLILGFVRLTELLSKRWNDYRFRIRVCRLPVISDFFRLLQTHSLAYPLGALLGVGLTLSEAIAFIKNDPEKAYLKETALRLERQLKEGKTLVEAISAIPLWMEEFPHVVEHGQLEGDLAKELEVYGRYCLEAFEDRMDRFIRVVQPAIFGLIALWILLMYFSILLPSYQLIETL